MFLFPQMNKYLSLKLKVLSFILIIMVVYVHSYNYVPIFDETGKIVSRGYNSFIQHLFSQQFLRIALRMFFLISGYLFFLSFKSIKEDYVTKIKKRTRQVAIPFVFWSALWIVIYFCLQQFPQTRNLFEGTLISEIDINGLLGTLFLHPIPFQLWSIRDLFLLALLSPILYILIKYFKYTAAIFFIITWYLEVNFYILSNETVAFFTIGATLSSLKSQIPTMIYAKKHGFIILIWILICFTATILDHIDFKNELILRMLHKTGILIGIMAIWVAYDLFPKIKNIEESKYFKIFSFSFFIFVFHIPLITFVRRLLFKFGNSELISLTIYIFTPIIVVSLSFLTGYYLKKLLPKFYEIISGGR